MHLATTYLQFLRRKGLVFLKKMNDRTALMHFRTSTVYNNVTMVNYISFGSQLHVEFNAVKIKNIPLNKK